MNSRLRFVLAAGAVLLSAGPAGAVIKLKLTIPKMYETARGVVVGTVTKVNADNRVIDVKVTATLKGDPVGEQVRIQIVTPADLIKQVAVDQPVVVLIAKARGGPVNVLHLADTWLLAEQIADASPPAWRVVQTHNEQEPFPGRTAALVRALEELKAGKSTLLNAIEQNVFRGGVKELGNLKAKPTFFLAADVNGDGKAELLVGAADGVRLFAPSASGYEDVTQAWGLAGAKGSWACFGDVNSDKTPDLLLGGALYLNDSKKFSPAKATFDIKPDPLAVGVVAGKDGKTADIAALSKTGELTVFENPGSVDKPWAAKPARSLWKDEAGTKPPFAAFFGDWGDNGKPHVMVVRENGVTRYALDDDGGPPADLKRLTGRALGDTSTKEAQGMTLLGAIPLDLDGSGRMDLLLITEKGGMALMNRGFGCYMVNPEASAAFRSHDQYKCPFVLKPTCFLAASDTQDDKFDDVLVLTEDGSLFVVDNPPYQVNP